MGGILYVGYGCTEDVPDIPGQRKQSWPNHDMTEGIMMLAVDIRPEAPLLIGLS